MTPHAWDEYRDRRDRERAALTNAEEHRLRRLRAERLARRIEIAAGLLGVFFIAAGALLYIATAPPVGGLEWELSTVLVSAALIAGGLAVIALGRWES